MKYAQEADIRGGQDRIGYGLVAFTLRKGMMHKLQPTHRLMSYIGASGIHMGAKAFQEARFDPVEAKELSASLERYPEEMCSKTCMLE